MLVCLLARIEKSDGTRSRVCERDECSIRRDPRYQSSRLRKRLHRDALVAGALLEHETMRVKRQSKAVACVLNERQLVEAMPFVWQTPIKSTNDSQSERSHDGTE
jgi:hypothetical protein